MKSVYWVVRNKKDGRCFVGTGGAYGGSTANRGVGRDIPPKLYGSAARAKGALKGSGKCFRAFDFTDWEVVPVHLEVFEPSKTVTP